MSESCDVIVIFRIFGQFGKVRRLDSGNRVCKIYVFINSRLKTKNENMPFTLLLGVKVLFWTKNAIFLRKKMLASAKLREPRYKKLYFLKLHIDVYLPAKFEVSRIILTSFRQGGGGNSPPHTSKQTPKKPSQIRVSQSLICNYGDDSRR